MESIDENRRLDVLPVPGQNLRCRLFTNPHRTARLLCNAGVAVALVVGAVFLTFLSSSEKDAKQYEHDSFYLDGSVAKVCSWDWVGGVFGHCINWTDTKARSSLGICVQVIENTSRCEETLLMESLSRRNAPLSVTGLGSDGSFRILYPSAKNAVLQLEAAEIVGSFPPGCENLKKLKFLGVEHISVIAPGITDDSEVESAVFRLGNLAFQKPQQNGPTNFSTPLTNSSWVYADYDWNGASASKCSWEGTSLKSLRANWPFPWPPGPTIEKVDVDVTFKHGWNFLRSTLQPASASQTGAVLIIKTGEEPIDHEWVFNYLPQSLPLPTTKTTTTIKSEESTMLPAQSEHIE